MLSHGRAHYTARSLRQLASAGLRDTELVLVDDGTPDTSVQEAINSFRRDYPDAAVKTIRYEKSVGAVKGRNDAVLAAEGEYVALLDNDCMPRTRAWLDELKATFERHPEAGIAAPRLVYPLSHKENKPIIQCAGCIVAVSGRVGYRGRGEPADAAHFAAEETLQAVISACWLTPRRLWLDIGGMDEAYSPYHFEDIDYCYAVRSRGLEVWYVPSVEMYHFENVTSVDLSLGGYAALTARKSQIFRKKWEQALTEEKAPPPTAVTWQKNVPLVRLEDKPALELI